MHDMKAVSYLTRHVPLQFRHGFNRDMDFVSLFFPQPRLILASRQDLASYARGMFLQAMEAQRIARNYAKSAKRSLRQVESLKQAKVNKNAANLPLLFFWILG